MSLTITNIQRTNGASCDHITVTVNDEGTNRTFSTSFPEIDAMFNDLTLIEQKKMLVILWAKYRRAFGRTVLNVEIT